MSYMHIPNLYRPEGQYILLFKECYALEKLHGTSAHVTWSDGMVKYHAGGEKQERFEKLFDGNALAERFVALGHSRVIVHGEAYGGKQQSQAWRYGPSLKFAAFEVHIESDTSYWLDVPVADKFVNDLGLEFVPYRKVSTDLVVLDGERDAPSAQAIRNGVEGDKPREGVVLRPLMESLIRGARVIAKHKRDDERETKTPRKVVDPSQLQVLSEANAIAEEWVTGTRLEHVLQKFPADIGMDKTREVIQAMVDDVFREGSGEVIDSQQARKAVATRARELFHAKLRKIAI